MEKKALRVIKEKQENLVNLRERRRREENRIEDCIAKQENLILEQINIQADICREIEVVMTQRVKRLKEEVTHCSTPSTPTRQSGKGHGGGD